MITFTRPGENNMMLRGLSGASCCDATSSRVHSCAGFFVRSWLPSALLACAGAGRKAASPPPQESTGRGESTVQLRECHCTWRMDMVSCHAFKPGVPLWVHDISWTFAFCSSLSTLRGFAWFCAWHGRYYKGVQTWRKLATSKKRTRYCECLWTFCCPSSIKFHFED